MESNEASRFWDREIVAPTHTSWMEHPEVREYINSYTDHQWPMDWFRSLFGRTFRRGLSIGCGGGALERDIVRKDVCERVDAFDASLGSLRLASAEAAAAGLEGRIRYFAADFNRVALPRSTYDIVFVHQALHHVSRLERLFSQIIGTLRPGGLLYIDEYIGPSRDDWNDTIFRLYRERYGRIPREARKLEVALLPIQPDDPSEAIRSSEIVPQLRKGFRVLHERGYGGNLLAVLYPMIDWQHASPELVRTLIDEERDLIERSGHFHTIIVAEPGSAARSVLVRLYYALRPKVLRARFELRHRLRYSGLDRTLEKTSRRLRSAGLADLASAFDESRRRFRSLSSWNNRQSKVAEIRKLRELASSLGRGDSGADDRIRATATSLIGTLDRALVALDMDPPRA